MADIRDAHEALIKRVVEGEGRASQAERRAAFANEGLREPVRTLVDKVVFRSFGVTDQDIASARASGLSEDQVFEIAVCAAVGQATRQYRAACEALESAAKQE